MKFAIKELLADDFEEAYLLLEGFNNTRIGYKEWQKMFQLNWSIQELPLGLKIIEEDSNKIVGVFGLLIHSRVINGEKYKFYNGTGWIIDPAYKGHKLGVMLPNAVFEWNDGIVTFLTPSEFTYKLLCNLGCVDMDTHTLIINPTYLPIINKCNLELVTDITEIKKIVTDDLLKIIDDHINLKAKFFVIKNKLNEYSYGVIKNNPNPIMSRRYRFQPKNWSKYLPTADMHYLTNPDIFSEYLNCNLNLFLFKFSIVSLFIDSRFMKGNKIKHAKITNSIKPKVYKGIIQPEFIDTLYSEIFLFDH